MTVAGNDFTLIDAIMAVKDIALIEPMVRALSEPLGVKAFCGGSVAAVQVRPTPLVYFNAWPEDWTALYIKRNYVHRDPMTVAARRRMAGFTWQQELATGLIPKRDLHIVHEASDFGMKDGFVVPLQARGEAGCVTFSGPQLCTDATGRLRLTLIAYAAYARAAELLQAPPAGPPLATREREVLAWAGNGKTNWEISQILGISEASVYATIQRARRKLGAGSRMQAVVAAMRRGEIAP